MDRAGTDWGGKVLLVRVGSDPSGRPRRCVANSDIRHVRVRDVKDKSGVRHQASDFTDLSDRAAVDVEVAVLAHGKWIAQVPGAPPFRVIDLEALPLPAGIPGQRWLSECAAFLDDTLLHGRSDYIWITSGRHNNKWVEKEGRRTRLEDLAHFVSAEYNWCTCLGLRDRWLHDDDEMHPGMAAAVAEMQSAFGLVNRHDTAYAHSLCISRPMLREFLNKWREMFWYFHEKYGTDLPFSVGAFDEARKGSYYYERVSMAILADWPGLTLRQIP